MGQKLKLEFKIKIKRVLDDGFTGLQEDYMIRFQDKKLKHRFVPSSELVIYIETADKIEVRPDFVSEGYSVFYVVINNFLSNGIQFSDINQEKGFFWNYRGIITNKYFESNDGWEKGTIIRIMLKQI